MLEHEKTPRHQGGSLWPWLGLLAVIAVTGVWLVAGGWFVTPKAFAQEKPTPAPPQAPPFDPFEGLPPMKATGKEVFFNFRPGPRPPGDIGKRERIPFPPPAPRTKPSKAAKIQAPPLKVVRITPKGEVTMIKAISVTFNQPMIPLSSLQDTRKKPIPLKLTPKIPGAWRWLGTSTLTYEVKGRYPYSTTYKIEVPKGVTSERGQKLAAPERATFSTPLLAIEASVPYRSATIPTTTAFAIRFNQDIRHEALARSLALRGPDGNQSFEVIPFEQWKDLKDLHYVAQWDKNRTIVLRPTRKLKKNASYTFALPPGSYSAEGPRPTKASIYLHYRTYGPLKIVNQGCWEVRRLLLFKLCRAEGSLYVYFSNALKPTQDINKLVTIEPADPKYRLNNYGTSVHLSHPEHLPASKTITLRFKGALEDVYGQTLGYDQKVSFQTTDLVPKMNLDRAGTASIEYGSKPELNLTLRNIRSFRQSLAVLSVDQLKNVQRWMQHLNRYNTSTSPPDLAWDAEDTIRPDLPWNQEGKILVDLNRVLKGKPGIVFVWLHSQDLKAMNKWENPNRLLVVQVTALGLAVRYGPDKIIALSNGLIRGEPTSAALRLIAIDGNIGEVWKGQSGKDGIAVLPGARELQRYGRSSYVLVAQQGEHTTALPIDNGGQDAKGYTSGYTAWSHPPREVGFHSYIFAEREPYKPGEKVHLRGIARQHKYTPLGGVFGLRSEKAEVKYKLYSPRWQIIKEGTIEVGKAGTFLFDYDLPEQADLGHYRFQGELWHGGNREHISGTFQVQAYRTPEYKVAVKTEEGPFFVGQQVKGTIEGRYTFGAAMAEASVSWALRRQQGSFQPPKQPSGFRFGLVEPYRPSWRGGYGYRGRHWGHYYHSPSYGQQIASGVGKLNAQGSFHVPLELKDETPASKKVLSYTFEAQVYDQNRQSIAGRTTLLGHRSSLYIGLRSTKPIVKAKEAFPVEVIAADIAGTRLSGQAVKIKVIEKKWNKSIVKGADGKDTVQWKEEEVSLADCALQTSDRIEKCSMRLPKAGYFTMRAEGTDAKSRLSQTEMGIYVFGDGYVSWKSNDPENLEMVADKDAYNAGDKAQILVKSPFRKAWGLLTLERNGIAEHQAITLDGSAQTIPVSIRPEYLPNVHLAVLLIRGRVTSEKEPEGPDTPDEADQGRPAFAFGQANLKVNLTEKQIGLTVTPTPSEIRPGGKLSLKITSRDHKGQGVPTLLSVALVDEGILSLLGFQTPDPLRAFYTDQAAQTVLRDLRITLLARKKLVKAALKQPPHESPPPPPADAPGRRMRNGGSPRPVTTAAPSAPMGGLLKEEARNEGESTASRSREILSPAKSIAFRGSDERRDGGGKLGGQGQAMEAAQLRTNFAATAFYQGAVETDAQGEVTLPIQMPDNLTTFRVMVVAVDPVDLSRFGKGEASVVVRKPLLLRPSLPRFANYGDRFEASVVANNESKQTGKVRIMARAVNLTLEGETFREVEIPAGEAREVRFPVRVAEIGRARIQFAAVMETFRDAVEVSIPVLIPATAEAFATYGTTKGSVAQSIKPPKDALPQFGGLQISVSSTALNGLEDAVRYLIDYPFECAEQTASRAMPIFALHRILPEFKIGKVEDEKAMKALATGAIDKLVRMQRSDGGWGYWGGSGMSWMWISGYITYALLRGQEAGYTVPPYVLSRAFSFLQNRLRHPHDWERYSYATHVMAAWILSEKKQAPGDKLNELYDLKKKLPLFAHGWLMVAMHRQMADDARIDKLAQGLRNRAEETASAIRFAEGLTESLRLLMHSNDRTDAILLQAFLEVRPKDSMIPKIVRGLLQARIRGRWMTTQSNAFAMLALSRYYAVYESEVPDFTLQSWLGDGFLHQIPMKGRDMKVVEQTVPMAFLQSQGKKDLVMDKKGQGRLYYRLGLRYAPKDLKLKPEEQGFAIKRVYEPIDKDSVRQDASGRWIFRAGTYSRVRLQITVPGQRYFVAVIDPLPAGLEGVNMAFQTSASTALASATDNKIYDTMSWYSLYAFNHKEMRDEMATLFADRLPAGIYEYTYNVRATTIGSFIIPPSRIEEMYHPETFGRSQTDFATVEEVKDGK